MAPLPPASICSAQAAHVAGGGPTLSLPGLLQRRKSLSGRGLDLERLRPEEKQQTSCPFARDYDMQEVIGSGSLASVRVAVRRSDGQRHAVKWVQSSDDEMRAFAHAEYELMKSVQHQHIMRAHEIYQNEVSVWICMDLYARGTVEQLVQRDGCAANYKQLTRELLDAISHLHSKRIVHRDVKPANLLLDDQDRLVLCDFNSAKRVGAAAAGIMLTDRGTHDYAAPELRFGQSWNERVDVWAAGLTTWFMLSGELPFHIMKPKVSQTFLLGHLPEMDWSRIPEHMHGYIRQSLAVDPSDRPPAMELLWHPALTRNEMGDIMEKAPSSSTARHGREGNTATCEALPCASLCSEADVNSTEENEREFYKREPRHGAEALQALAKAKSTRGGRKNPDRFHTAFGASSLEWDAPDGCGVAAKA